MNSPFTPQSILSSSSSSSSPVTPLQNGTFTHILGQGRVNQLGGVFINGRPLPHNIRLQIIDMATKGVKPCQISRQLRVSHGAVSKILNRYAETGSVFPGQMGGTRSRLAIEAVQEELTVLIRNNPSATASELRSMLIQRDYGKQVCVILQTTVLIDFTCVVSVASPIDFCQEAIVSLFPGLDVPVPDLSTSLREVCCRSNVPSLSSISRFQRSLKNDKEARRALSHSIDSILGLPSVNKSSSSSDDDSPDLRRNRTNFTARQIDALEAAFSANSYPDPATRDELVRTTNITEEKIMTWFSNRRARCRKNLPLLHNILMPSISPSLFTDIKLTPLRTPLLPHSLLFPTPPSSF